MQQHPRTRVAHHYFYFGFHVGFVAVDGAFAAGCLALLEWALVEPHLRVLQKCSAFPAQLALGWVMVVVAVDVHHGFYGLFFSGNSRMFSHWANSPSIHPSNTQISIFQRKPDFDVKTARRLILKKKGKNEVIFGLLTF
jgi:hypothetical protein